MENIIQNTGNTPVALIDGITVKLEYANPSGSIKDRFVFNYLEELRAGGRAPPGTRMAEATTGNTGISAAMWAALRGCKFTAFVPQNASAERLAIMRGLGASVVQAPTVGKAVRLKEEYLAGNRKAISLEQFSNPRNPYFMETLGEELLEHQPEAVVAGVGTGGTLIGVARVLRKQLGTRIVAVEPSESPLLAQGKHGQHLIEGIGEDFIPEIISRERHLIDEIALVPEREALAEMKLLWKRGIFVGTSSAANLMVAKRIAKQGLRVATVFPDNGYRYCMSR